MPATGLQDVKQKIDGDATGIVRAYFEAKQGADDYALATGNVTRATTELRTNFLLLGREADTVRAAFGLAGGSLGSYITQVKLLREAQAELAETSRQQAAERKTAADEALFAAAAQVEAQRMYNAQMIKMANDHMTAQRELAAQIEKTGDAINNAVIMKAPTLSRAMDTISNKIRAVSTSLKQTEADIVRVATSPEVAKVMAVTGGGAYGAFSPSAVMPGPGQASINILGPALAAALSREPSLGVREGASGISASTLAAAAAASMGGGGSDPRRRDTLFGAGAVAMLSAIHQHGGGGSIGTGVAGGLLGLGALASMPGRAGGPPNIPGFLGDLAESSGNGPGTAAATFGTVAAFTKRWYPFVHWATMLTNEMLATVGPAVVAGGMGALVGAQSAEQLMPRAKAIFATAESLGDSLGITTGQAWGLKGSPLQSAQDLATGSGFELAGAGVNIVRAGAGDSFIKLGTNTVAMFDRFAATMTEEFQKGLGKQLGDIVSGGTGYLQQIGDVFANLGDVFLHVAPNLPGVGGDLLSTVNGALGGLSRLTSFLGPSLGPILSFEAGARWGPTLVGGLGKALQTGGIGAAALGEGTDSRLAGTALGDILSTGGKGIGAAGTVIAGLSAPEIGAIAASVFTIGKGLTYKTQAQQDAAAQMTNIGQMGFSQGLPSIISAMQGQAGVPGGSAGGGDFVKNMSQGIGGIFGGIGRAKPSEFWHGVVQDWHGLFQMLGVGAAQDPTNSAVAQQQIQKLSETMVNSLGAGRQVADVWKGVSGSTLDMASAYDVATMAQLQLGSAFKKNGELTPVAKTMIANLQAGYQAMTFSGGQFGSAVGAQTAMAGLQHTQLASVNAEYDQLLQMVTGGATGSAGFFATLGGTPVTAKGRAGGGGIQFQAPPAFGQMAKALTSFTSPAGAGAWNTFASQSSSSPGLVTQLGSQFDWLRTMQTMGALNSGQTTGMAAFMLQQILPMARKSPAALGMVSTLAQEFGGPAMGAGSQEQNFQKIASWTKQFANSAKEYNQNMNQGSVAASNIPRDAQQFVQQVGSNITGALAQGLATHGSALQNTFMNSIVPGKGFSLPALEKYGKFMAGAGVPKQGAIDMAKYAAQLAGAGPGLQAMIGRQLGNLYAKLKVQVDASQVQAALGALKSKDVKAKVNVQGASELKTLQSAIDALKSKTVRAAAQAQGAGAVAALNAEIAALHSKEVTITTRMITIGGMPGVTVGIPAGVRAPGMAGGGLIPGSGSGDTYPAMLTPGEVVVPRNLVSFIAPFLAAHKVPGFGGVPGSSGSHFALGGMVPVNNIFPHIPDPTIAPDNTKLIEKLIAQLNKDLRNSPVLKQFSVEVIKGIFEGMKNIGPQSKKIAQDLMSKIAQEIAYAKSTAANLKSGLNLGGMNVDPASGSGSVADQMQSYLTSLKTFSKDISALSHGHLNKDLLKQIIAAGPVQGDALAQSILNPGGTSGKSGIGQVNQLFAQIGKMSSIVGAQAAGAVFGGTVAPNLKSGTFVTNNVSISVGSQGGSSLGGLTDKQINALVAMIQKKLLQQAQRNRKTGVKLKSRDT